MTAEWLRCRWGDLATLEYGRALRATERSFGAYQVFGTNGPIGWHSTPLFDHPGVVIGRKGAYRGIHYAQRPPWVIDTAFFLRLKDRAAVDSKFAYYQLKTVDLNSIDSGSAIPSTSRDAFNQIHVLLPPVQAQRKIASALTAYDDVIENNNRRIKILDEMEQRIYREWFAAFRYPGHESVPLVESELGLIPEGWATSRVGDIARVIRGRSYRGTEVGDIGGVPFVNLKCIARDGGFRRDGVKRFLGEFRPAHTACAGDIVMAVTDMTQERRIVARVARVPNLGEPIGVVSMDLVRIEPIGVEAEFLLGLLRYSGFADAVKQHANGANVLHLHPDRITQFQAVIPPGALGSKFAQVVGPLNLLGDALESANASLRTARDILLPRLISGQINVENLDIEVPEEAA